MTDEQERRLMEALDAGKRPADDPALAEALSDPEFARTAAEFEALEGWLRDWETPAPSDVDFDALARRVEQRLGESFEDDATQPPVFDDPDARVRTLKGSVSSGSYSLSALTAPAAAKPGVASTGPGPAVVLGEKRRQASRVPMFLAAAAMVGLAVTAGVATMSSSDEPMMASAEMAPAEMAPAEMAPAQPEAIEAPAPASVPVQQAPQGDVRGGAESDAEEEPFGFAEREAASAADDPTEPEEIALASPAEDGETRARPRARYVDGLDDLVGEGGRGGSAGSVGGSPSLGSAMRSSAAPMAAARAPAPDFPAASDSRDEATASGNGSLDDRLRACAGPRPPTRVSLQLTIAERRVTAVRVRSPSSLASQSDCFVRALRDERFDGGPHIERTYRLTP